MIPKNLIEKNTTTIYENITNNKIIEITYLKILLKKMI